MILKGKGICAGYAFGRISIYSRTEAKVVRRKCRDAEGEIVRFNEARLKTKEEYLHLYEKALNEVGNNNAAIFKADVVMLDDMDYIESVCNIIRSQHVNAEYAVAITIDNFAHMIMGLADDYIRDRATDVREVYNRVIAVLSGIDRTESSFGEKVILFSRDLTPSEIVRLDKTNIIGLVMGENNSNSHAAILSKSMNIPAVASVDLYGFVDDDGKVIINDDIAPQFEGRQAIIDGYMGRIIIDPSEEDIELYTKRMEKEAKNKELMSLLKGKETVTLSGRKIALYANVNGTADVASALTGDAEGVGLYRSEYLFMGRDSAPSEEEQFSVYRMIAENMGGKKVIIRTADIGSDKPVGYLDLDVENNPALGYRGIRLSLDMRDMFITQLRAIYRASYYGNIAIMFPMITSVKEVLAAKKIAQDIMEELAAEGYPYKECEIGIMIETPAAVMISDKLAQEVDFFSIGTNDLSQYTLAVDRTNSKVDKYYNPYHEAILRMISMTVENAHKNDCRVGICGEMAASEQMIPILIEYGIDEFSVAPGDVLAVRNVIRKIK